MPLIQTDKLLKMRSETFTIEEHAIDGYIVIKPYNTMTTGEMMITKSQFEELLQLMKIVHSAIKISDDNQKMDDLIEEYMKGDTHDKSN